MIEACTQKFTKSFGFRFRKQFSISSLLHLSYLHPLTPFPQPSLSPFPRPFSHRPPSSRRPSPSPPPSSPPSRWWPPPPSSPPPSQAPGAVQAWGCGGSSPSPLQWRPPSDLPNIYPSSCRQVQRGSCNPPQCNLSEGKMSPQPPSPAGQREHRQRGPAEQVRPQRK